MFCWKRAESSLERPQCSAGPRRTWRRAGRRWPSGTPEDGSLKQDLRPVAFAPDAKNVLDVKNAQDAAPHHILFVSPDGRIALSQSPVKRGGYVRLRVWSVAEAGRRAVPLFPAWETAAPRHPVSFAVSRDGSRVAVVDVQDKVRVADMATGKILLERAAEGSPALSPDGKLLAYIGQRPGPDDKKWGVQIIRTDDGKPLEDVLQGKFSALRFSPDGSRLAVVTPYTTILYHLKNVLNNDAPQSLPKQALITQYALSAAFAPDSRALAIGNGGGDVSVFDVGSGRQN